MAPSRSRVAVLGSGNIGIDLCERLLLDDDFEVVALAGRRPDSPGLRRFEGRIPVIASDGISGIVGDLPSLDGVFDATSSFDHPRHWEVAHAHGKWMVDLTPSGIGRPMVPSLIGKLDSMTLAPSHTAANYSMITCGGQASAPLLYAISRGASGINDVEISVSAAAISVGLASRRNIDHYVEATEHVASLVTGCSSAKAILVINPADPPIMMRTTVTVSAAQFDLDTITAACAQVAGEVRRAVPGYDIVVSPHSESDHQIQVTARVTGAGYYLPPSAGNLDIINSAAVETARKHARHAADEARDNTL
jgi:acetaldehyde dehydrogenase